MKKSKVLATLLSSAMIFSAIPMQTVFADETVVDVLMKRLAKRFTVRKSASFLKKKSQYLLKMKKRLKLLKNLYSMKLSKSKNLK